MKNKLFKLLGFTLTLLSFYYIYLSLQAIKIDWHTLVEIIKGKSVILILISLLVYLLVLFVSAIFWSFLIQCFSGVKKIEHKNLVAVYAKSNLGKYLPGNFMQFVGRNLLGFKLGYTHSILIISTIFEISYVLATGLILLTFMLLFNLSDVLLPIKYLSTSHVYLILSLISISIIIMNCFRQEIKSFIQKYKVIPRLRDSVIKGFMVFLLVYLFLGLANFLLICIFIPDCEISDYFNVLFAFLLSWIIGFIIPGAPGGIGIREAVFIFLLSPTYGVLAVSISALIFRLINLIGDVLFFMVFINSKETISHKS